MRNDRFDWKKQFLALYDQDDEHLITVFDSISEFASFAGYGKNTRVAAAALSRLMHYYNMYWKSYGYLHIFNKEDTEDD